jgi:hypothetical protein
MMSEQNGRFIDASQFSSRRSRMKPVMLWMIALAALLGSALEAQT